MNLSISARTSMTLLLVTSFVGGCVIPKSVGDGPDGGESTGSSSESVDAGGPGVDASGGSTSGASGQTPTTTAPPDSTGDTDPAGSEDTGFTFLIEGDGGGIIDPCSPWAQDCPNGEKCSPSSLGGGSVWDFWRCSEVPENPDAVGEPCMAEGSPTSGIDSCDFGAFCWEVDPKTLEGTCVALCTGSEDLPSCPGSETCLIANEGILPLCLDSCDPLLQDCGPDHACYPGESGFACLPAGFGGTGAPGDSCENLAACDHGNVCVEPESVPDCGSIAGCCTAVCSLGDPMPSCLPGQVCTPWFQAGMVPAGYEDVGVCALP
ncbi:hypothetical protein [Paraliomyxa miuraensis]|uniref:hypothetical protein n=1 Tax=Paraliomyxa miuraensis TaxID=376150 RepID=UPI00224F8136|nr:hypothetical protein [Paraliomyxa miuraensis]MCX4240960.1 hypothetical protein [Paraliomyxa miuraensis]